MRGSKWVLTALMLVAGLAPGLRGQEWGFEQARHLLARAGFGGPPEEVERLVELGRRRAVDALLEADGMAVTEACPVFEVESLGRPPRRELMGLGEDERRKKVQALRRRDRAQSLRFRNWWIERMINTEAPLTEKMTLFWHGHFTSSMRDVRNSYNMVMQNDLLREHALGNFGKLLHAVSKDPAMLRYLDNNRNRKGKPNENFAREVMELFTLGLGNYTERDIKEAARAFTGWTFRGDEFVFLRRRHDDGVKVILGRKGNFDGDDVLDILLEQEAAYRHIASRLIAWFVGPEAPAGMVDDYAGKLKRSGWEIKPVLRDLFNDPRFYAPEVMGSRILSPVEYLVGICRRLGTHPPGGFLAAGADMLGQSLLAPPNVKGWEGGEAWITTSTLIARGNLAGYLVEGFDPRRITRDFAGPAVQDEEGRMMDRKARMAGARKALRAMFRGSGDRKALRWRPDVGIRRLPEVRNVASAVELVDRLCRRLLLVPVTAEARRSLITFIEEESRDGDGFRLPSEPKLKRLARLILSLPEAQIG